MTAKPAHLLQFVDNDTVVSTHISSSYAGVLAKLFEAMHYNCPDLDADGCSMLVNCVALLSQSLLDIEDSYASAKDWDMGVDPIVLNYAIVDPSEVAHIDRSDDKWERFDVVGNDEFIDEIQAALARYFERQAEHQQA